MNIEAEITADLHGQMRANLAEMVMLGRQVIGQHPSNRGVAFFYAASIFMGIVHGADELECAAIRDCLHDVARGFDIPRSVIIAVVDATMRGSATKH